MVALDDWYNLFNLAFFWSFALVTMTLTFLNVFFIKNDLLSVMIAIGIASVYSIYLLIDTQLILGGRKV